MLSDEQTDYVDGTAFRATGINRIIGDVGDNWVGSNSIKLDAFLKTDIYRSAQLLGGANMTGDEIVVTGTTPFMRQNNIDARYSSDNLDPNSTQAKIYQVLPTLFAQDQSTRQMSALGMATDGQRAIVAQEFAGIRDDLQVVVTTEIAIACGGLSATCAGALTTAAVVDCAQNPGLVSCGAAAAGVAVPVVRVVRGVNASNGANAANAVDDAAAIDRAAVDALNPANAQIKMLQGTPKSELTYSALVNGAHTLDVATMPNTAVFYSGGTRSSAEAYAAANGLKTLEQTAGGQYLDDLRLFDDTINGVSKPGAFIIWSKVSTEYASKATGSVTAILDMKKLQNSSVFMTTELPTLLNNIGVSQVVVKTTAGNSITIPKGTSLDAAIKMIRKLK